MKKQYNIILFFIIIVSCGGNGNGENGNSVVQKCSVPPTEVCADAGGSEGYWAETGELPGRAYFVYGGRPLIIDGTRSNSPHGIVTYEWDFGDGTEGNGPTPSHTYVKKDWSEIHEDIYTVQLWVTDNNQNRAWDYVYVIVSYEY